MTAAVAAVVVALLAVTVVFSADGLPAVDASSARATRWFVHRPSGTVVLADGYAGRAVASTDTEAQGTDMSVAESAAGAYLLNDSTAEVRSLETADFSLGAPINLAALGDGRAIAAVGPAGLTVVNPVDDEATVLSTSGEASTIEFTTGDASDDNILIAPDGVIWSIDGALLRRQTASSSTATARTCVWATARGCRWSATSRSSSTRATAGRGSETARGSGSTQTSTRASSWCSTPVRPPTADGSVPTTNSGA